MVGSQETINRRIAVWPTNMIAIIPILFSLVSCSPQQDQEWVVSSDRKLQRMAQEVLEDVTKFSGLEILEQIHLDYLTAEEISEYVQSRIENSLSESEEQHIVESYTLLGLFPMNLNLRQTLSTLYGEQVIGFYDPKDKALYLQEDVPLKNLKSLLVHEMVHALQDQHFDLESLAAPELSNDEQTAMMAAIEGHATLVMLETLSEGSGNGSLNLKDVSEFGESIANIFESTYEDGIGIDSVPLVLRESMFFPYIHGSQFVKKMRIRYGINSVPFGSRFPRSTAEILHYGEPSFDGNGPPVTIRIQPDSKWIKLYENTLGELEVGVFLENLSGERVVSEGWKGDRFALLEGVGGSKTLVWFSVWDTIEDRNLFSGIVKSHLELLPGDIRLSSLNIDGIPGLKIDIGSETNAEITLEKN
jgi:hypothetical protein